MKFIHLIALSLAATFFAEAASASLTPFARAYTVDGWSLVGYAGGTGAKHVRRYIGLNRKTVSVSMTGFRARATHRDCYGRDPDSCYGMTTAVSGAERNQRLHPRSAL